MGILIALLPLLMFIHHTTCSIISKPVNTVYKNGVHSEGFVACVISPTTGTVYWSAGDTIIYSSPNNNNPSKYGISPTAAVSGNYSLTIKNLQRSDTLMYKCQHGGEVAKANIVVAG